MTRWGPVAAVVLLALTAGCGGSTEPAARPSGTTAASGTARQPSAAAPATVGKLVVVVVENHSLEEMRAEMPFLEGLGNTYGRTTDYHAVAHPSLPNYLAMTGGSTYGVTDDDYPSAHPVQEPSVFGQALSDGRTAKVYADAMTEPCETESAGRYAVKHNPWTYHVAERDQCTQYDVPLDALAADVTDGRLPDVGMVVPDMCNDAHDCPLSTADAWLKDEVGLLMSGPDWRSGRLAVVVTADEDDYTQDNLILTVVAHPSLHGVTVTEPLDHYSLARAYSEVAGGQPMGEAASAPSLLSAFGLEARGG